MKIIRGMAPTLLCCMAALICIVIPPNTHAQAPPAQPEQCKILVLGFLGGTEFPHHKHSGIVQIEKEIRASGYPDVCVRTFVPYSWQRGDRWLMEHYPRHNGTLSQSELENAPKTVIYGHSLGGWATLAVARKLEKRGIPVELAVQIASVGVTDHTVPPNVKVAANFYSNDIVGNLIGTKRVHVRDKKATRFLGNRNMPHTNHLSITRDREIAELIMETIRSLRGSPPAKTGGAEYPYCY